MNDLAKQGAIAFLFGMLLAWVYLILGTLGAHAATTLLPNGEQCFQTGAGPVSSGSVYMLVPASTTPKNTWQDSGQTTLNTNPIQLDANGCAIIYGTGSYRQQLYSGPVVSGLPTGNLIYDQLTADTSSYQNVFWAGLSGGTPNAITVTDAGFNFTDGSIINFVALNTNTTGTTLNVSSTGAKPILLPSSSGPVALTAGQITANNPVSVVWSSSANAFLLLTGVPLSTGGGNIVTATPAPGGYLALSGDSNNIIITSDVTGAVSVNYWPYVSNQLPIWNGSSFTIYSFTGLTVGLTGSQSANTIYDICAFVNNGAPTLAVGPAWSNSAAGAGSRGTGAGSAQLQRQNGIWVNAVQITGLNGASSFTIPAEQCTYLGSILIDNAAGQVSNYVSWGQSRKWGVWNAYNRQKIQLQVGDNTAGGWNYNTATFRASNNSTANSFTFFTGLAEEPGYFSFQQGLGVFAAGTQNQQIGIGINSTSSPSGTVGTIVGYGTVATQTTAAVALFAPALGAQTITSLEKGSAGTASAFYDTQTFMVLLGEWRG